MAGGLGVTRASFRRTRDVSLAPVTLNEAPGVLSRSLDAAGPLPVSAETRGSLRDDQTA